MLYLTAAMLLIAFIGALAQGALSFSTLAHNERCELVTEALTVHTSNGPIIGHVAPNTSCVLEFLGIPYAKPPIGGLRFAPPQRITTVSSDPYEASEFGFDCPLTPSKPVNGYPGFTPQAQRIINYFASAAGTPQSEDCLTLNIWTRGPASNTADINSKSGGKPVLVFFYGGRFTIGNTNTPFYNGKHFAQAQDIIIVTVNYRLNIFGFPGGGSPNMSQNLGLRDQRLAVEWVRDNIGAFGGDPSKITISGQSSGGVSVDYWAYSYSHDPIVHGMIAHSGNTFSFPANTKAIQQSNWDAVVKAANCSHTTNTSTAVKSAINKEKMELECMRTIPYQTILTAASSLKPTKSSSILRSIPPFWPTPDNEIVFTASEYLSLTSNGSFARIPVLLGSTHDENGYYQVAAFASQGVLPTQEQVNSFLLESFTCPVAYQASARRRFGVQAYTYRYFADWEITRLWVDETTGQTSGAYHGVDLHMLFGAAEEVSGLVGSDEEALRRKALTRLMQRAWFVFADDPVGGLTRELGWPGFDAGNGKSLAVLGVGNKAELGFEDREVYDNACNNVTMGALSRVG